MNERRLSYTTRGEGLRHMFMLHGFLGAGRNLASLSRRLSERRPETQLILPDLTGHGQSPPLPPGADLSTLAHDVLALAAELGAETFEVIGHSLGGRVALKMRALAPNVVGAVTLLDIAPGKLANETNELDPAFAALLAAPEAAPSRDALRPFFLERGLSRELTDWLLMNLEPGPDGGVRWRISREAMRGLNLTTRHEDLWPTVEARRTPTHCIRGGSSPFVSDADVARLTALGCRVSTIPGAGHFLHIGQSHDALLELLAT